MKTMFKGAMLATFALALYAAPVRAEDVKAGDLVISQAWSRATPGGAKVAAQARAFGWPAILLTNEVTPDRLQATMEWLVTDAARAKATACRDAAIHKAHKQREDAIRWFSQSVTFSD